MDGKKFEREPNPEERANILSKIFFLWTGKIFRRGLKKPPLTVNELYRPLSEDSANYLGNLLEEKWMKELKKARLSSRKPKLLYAVIKAFGLSYGSLAFIHVISELFLRLLQPILLGQVLLYFTPNSQMTSNEALLYAASMIGSIFLSSLLGNHYMKKCFQYGMKLRVACSSVIYRKSLKINKSALGDKASGQVVNLLSNDVSRFDIVPFFIHYMWTAPISAIAVMYYMWIKAGPISLVGILAIITIVPLQSYTGKLASKFRLQTAYKTDERIRLMDEIICGIQVIKMYAWEKPFSQRISASRAKELEKLKRSSYVRGLYMTFNLFTTRFSIFCTMLALSLTGGSLSPDKIFVYSTYFGMLSFNLSGMYVRGFAEIAESLVSLGRLTNFLLLQEVSDTGDNLKLHEKQNEIKVRENRGEIILQEATARWQPDSKETTLHNITLEIKKGTLNAVVGTVGCGKSSLLQALLGELKFTEGKVSISGIISYCSQEPWVFASSVRQNITFGLPFDKLRYAEVINACALKDDFSQFPEGDKTIIGDRGASLSGGQRARINLARWDFTSDFGLGTQSIKAIYKDADIYLLDDPLSAVDTHVAKHLFEECLIKFLKNKTRILVTHQLQYLRKADYIVLLDNGIIQYQGVFTDLSKSDFDFAQLFKSENDEENKEKKIKSEGGERGAVTTFRQVSVTSSRSNLSIKTGNLSESVESLAPAEAPNLEEMKSDVNVSFIDYFLSGINKCTLFILFSFFLLAQTSASLCDFWMSVWASQDFILQNQAKESTFNISKESFNLDLEERNETQRSGVSGRLFQGLTTENYRIIYSVLVVSLFVIALTRSIFFYNICMKCSQKLHDLMFVKICQTHMSFFHNNPSEVTHVICNNIHLKTDLMNQYLLTGGFIKLILVGRILNRFSKDLGSIDELLPKALLDAFQNIMVGVGAVVLTLVVNLMYLVPIILVLILGGLSRYVFVRTSTVIKKIEGITRGPVFSHLNATLQGITTVRAFGAQQTLKNEFDSHQDLHTAAMSLFIGISTAFGYVIDLLCLTLVAFVTFLLILIQNNSTGGEVGLAITQILAITGLVQWGMRQSAEISNQLVSVERVLEYTNLESEENLEAAPEEKEMEKLLSSWPREGKIEFKSTFLYYGATEIPAIKNFTVCINPGEKIGIIGRTGAGKSSIIAALFRLARIEGKILIDGIDTSTVSLMRLRKSISIIPQEPVLFIGSIRKNLDPFENYSDAKLWQAIEEVELKDALLNGLDSIVQEGGNNFSVGQKQLLCLARALLRNNRILLLDEATANVDTNTDSLIQTTIRSKFADCTVLTIAHRLNTIMDCDKVLVMDEGMMMEFDKPYNLLQISNGYFTRLVQQTGPAMAAQLRQMAEQHRG